ncbi:MAG: DUF4474 domain-containing protein [Oscillospiraceae bacterium]|nr:DUF4474 domain-containing protein [Oscillospiraceae bacterium]
MFYVGSRYYDPEFGRWLNTDPLIDEGVFDVNAGLNGTNLFVYCANNPIMLIDKTGKAVTSVLWGLGYWDSSKGIFYYSINAPQRDYGFCSAYDNASWLLGMDIAWLTVYFTAESKDWRIEFRKGTYGKIYAGDVSTGAEIGVYYRKWWYFPGWYQCADNANTLKMSYSLYKNGSFLFSRSSTDYNNYNGRHWWLTGFKPFIQSKPNQLKMKVSITLKSVSMAEAFVTGLKKSTGNKGTGKAYSISRSGATVSFWW